MSQPLLSGEQEYVELEDVSALHAEIRDLRRKLAHAELDTKHATETIGSTLAELKRLTLPFLNLLKAVHGEIDALGIADATSAPPSRNKAIWESWKQKLGGGNAAKFIDILLEHGEMTSTQLRIAAHCSPNTVPNTIYKLNQAGLINKNGGKFSLKEL